MYIKTDDDNNIIELIFTGVMPEKNGYEVDSIEENIISDILNYKYINGQFVKRELQDMSANDIEIIKTTKIEAMRSICNATIENGIDFNNSHYSLTPNDQMELWRLESIARESLTEIPIYYHADNEKYRLYTQKEFLSLVSIASKWITYHRTYFNLLKSEINQMTDIKQIIDINYGDSLSYANKILLDNIVGKESSDTIELISSNSIQDNFNYKTLLSNIKRINYQRGFKNMADLAMNQNLVNTND